MLLWQSLGKLYNLSDLFVKQLLVKCLPQWKKCHDRDSNTHFASDNIRAQLHGSAYPQILPLRSRFPAYAQAPNFCASLVSVESLEMRSTHAQKPKFAANP